MFFFVELVHFNSLDLCHHWTYASLMLNFCAEAKLLLSVCFMVINLKLMSLMQQTSFNICDTVEHSTCDFSHDIFLFCTDVNECGWL
jgi:hypothetical protein